MPGPAARMGDSTAHGGVIAAGFPQVLIGGQPAARLLDNHVCPMQTPGTPPIPHVGGPVSGPGVPTVLIGNMPAATMGDMLVCVGPPDAIIKGCPTVVIGMAGSGAASGGGPGGGGAGGSGSGSGGGTLEGAAENLGFDPVSAAQSSAVKTSSAAAAAASAAFTVNSGNKESTAKEGHWIEFKFVDSAGLPVSGVPYALTLPDGQEVLSVLDNTGTVRRGGLEATGQADILLTSLTNAEWSTDRAKVGDKVHLSVEADGFKSGTDLRFHIYMRDVAGADKLVATLETRVEGTEIEAEWAFSYPEPPEEIPAGNVRRYAMPQFFFEAVAGQCKARSGMLEHDDVVEIMLKTPDGQPLGGEEYVLTFSNGMVRRGVLDRNGRAREENVPPAHWSVVFPNL